MSLEVQESREKSGRDVGRWYDCYNYRRESGLETPVASRVELEMIIVRGGQNKSTFGDPAVCRS